MLSCFWRCRDEAALTFYSTDRSWNKVANGGNGPEQSQIKAHLFYRVLRGQIKHSAGSDFLSILWVKCCLGNLEKARQAAAGRVGWGRLLRGSWTTVYCKWRVLNEKTIQEEKREAEEATDLWLGWFVLLVYTLWKLTTPTIREKHKKLEKGDLPCTKSWDLKVKATLFLAIM